MICAGPDGQLQSPASKSGSSPCKRTNRLLSSLRIKLLAEDITTTHYLPLNGRIIATRSGCDTIQEPVRTPEENHEFKSAWPIPWPMCNTLYYRPEYCISRGCVFRRRRIKGRRTEEEMSGYIEKKSQSKFQPWQTASPRLWKPRQTEQNRPVQVTPTCLSNNARKISIFHIAMPSVLLPSLSAFPTYPLSVLPNCHPKCSSDREAKTKSLLGRSAV